jgi:hypothetical protein
VYTAVITADSMQSTAFITFTASTRKISWASPSAAGVYTVTITGTISKSSGDDIVASNNFVLTVFSC